MGNSTGLQQALNAIRSTSSLISDDDETLLKNNTELQQAVNALHSTGQFSYDDWLHIQSTEGPGEEHQKAVNALHSIGQFSYTGDFGHWANYANWDKLKDDKTLQQAVNALDSIGELSKDNWAKIARNQSLRTIISKLHLSNKFTPGNWQKLDKNHEQLKEVNKEIPDLEHYVQDQTKATASKQFSLSVHHAKLEYLTTGKKTSFFN
ncbi:hypothetical protein [Piscirickettsia salmonis]|uniref:Uncharacterized protein n=2 Tax=Piscirickettsia salmonis TaxID=1238 RepID=A0A9Q5YJK6_PISSA|nr:hypothetical protein [Piscirickettsia salmonis]APS55802.1 hypothetical protein AVI52_00095 [Piscirickettsia salmonis]ERL60970.1 hypothetical protein K661_02709 [Piscirickettsia salmonis LF-89 = ATCC VR-1361]PEQ15882.1 hypothetical protein X973_10240 [Piscirickettsia salmonis]QGN77202.1 hypothetical protein Psal001_01408 [Piscirickettsia salmonis]QGN80791.1 hypothetical protein Psal002_01432 [Piscirickettsia salmonis]